MNSNLNFIYSLAVRNISSVQKSSTERKERNFKDNDNNLFTTRLENARKVYEYINEIKNCYPNTTVTVKSMTAADAEKYCEEWKKQPINYSKFKHSIIVSSKVLLKMEKDTKYAEQMLARIKKAAIPEGFGNASIYEYKVVVRDDGEIENFACADFMNGKSEKTDDDNEKKTEKKKVEKESLEPIYVDFTHRREGVLRKRASSKK